MAHPDDGTASSEPSGPLVIALRRILRPLVKFLISQQITYPFLINQLKALYVEVAEQDFPMPGKKQTDSRISLLSGVHRKDVKRLRAAPPSSAQLPASVSVGAQLLARWLGEPRFRDAGGEPRALPLRAQQPGESPTFDDLVEDIVRQDIRPRAVLDELLRLDIVALDPEGRVRLLTRAFTPGAGLEEKLFFFGKNLQDHIGAGVHNLLGGQPPFFDRSVYYDELSKESLGELRDLCQRLGMDVLLTVNQKALELQGRDRRQPAGERYRMNFGMFHYESPLKPTGDSSDE